MGTDVLGSSGIEETSQVLSLASNATLASLTRSNGLYGAPELNVMPGMKPAAPLAPAVGRAGHADVHAAAVEDTRLSGTPRDHGRAGREGVGFDFRSRATGSVDGVW